MKLRLFIGMTAPPVWKSALTEWRRKTQARLSDSFGRWTSESNLHLTLRFFGTVEELEIPAITQKIRQVAATSALFSLALGPFGCFPSASRPRILWLGFKGATDCLIQLESTIRNATGGFGQPPEDRPFHPHLTLARLKEPTRGDRVFIMELIRTPSPINVPAWQIHELELIRSRPGREGSVYTTLATIPLG